MNFGENFRKIIASAALIGAGSLSSEKALAQKIHREKPKSKTEQQSVPELSMENQKAITDSLQNLVSKLIQENIIRLDTEHYDGGRYVGNLGKYKVQFSDDIYNKGVNLTSSEDHDWASISYEDEQNIKYSVMKDGAGAYGSARSNKELPGFTKMHHGTFAQMSHVVLSGVDSTHARKLTYDEIQRILSETEKLAEAVVREKNTGEKIDEARKDLEESFNKK